jgi:hypothetical protein
VIACDFICFLFLQGADFDGASGFGGSLGDWIVVAFACDAFYVCCCIDDWSDGSGAGGRREVVIDALLVRADARFRGLSVLCQSRLWSI